MQSFILGSEVAPVTVMHHFVRIHCFGSSVFWCWYWRWVGIFTMRAFSCDLRNAYVLFCPHC